MTTLCRLAAGCLLPFLTLAAGCSHRDAKLGHGSAAEQGHAGHHGGHSHERDKSLLTDAGPYHARLTAHLSSKDGHELDVFFETADDELAPVAVPLASFKAQARTQAGDLKELIFEPAPADERPKDEKPGACSHFVAKAPWLKPTEKLYVVAKLPLDGKEATARWQDFVPKKYAHHED